jgi:ubiquinone biosynthesis protein
VAADLRLCASFAQQAEHRVPELRRLRPEAFVRELSRSLRAELDLRLEGRNLERMRANLPAGSALVVPAAHASYTTERLLVMDFLPGPDLDAWLRDPSRTGPAPSKVAALGAQAILRMVFVDGLYHADPHPGNVLVLPDGRLGLIDFGMVGTLAEDRRREFIRLLHAVASRDVDEAVEVLSDWGGEEVEPELLRHDCGAFIDRYHGLPLRRVDTAALLGDLTGLLRENGLFLPPDVAMLIKVFLTLDSLGRVLDPDFVMAVHLEPFAERIYAAERAPLAVARRGATSLAAALASLPRDLQRLSARLRRGKMRIDVDTPRLERFGHVLERSVNRLTIGIVTAALIIGTSIAMTVSGGPTLLGLPAFALIGFLSSLATGLWLIVAVLRTQRD